jgi:hypothetical protein
LAVVVAELNMAEDLIKLVHQADLVGEPPVVPPRVDQEQVDKAMQVAQVAAPGIWEAAVAQAV